MSRCPRRTTPGAGAAGSQRPSRRSSASIRRWCSDWPTTSCRAGLRRKSSRRTSSWRSTRTWRASNRPGIWSSGCGASRAIAASTGSEARTVAARCRWKCCTSPRAAAHSATRCSTSCCARSSAELPPTPRIVVTLRFQEDLDLAEIAAIVDMPLNTVKSHLRRSMEALRRKLADRGHVHES